MDDLKEKRGFGKQDPVPLISLYANMAEAKPDGTLGRKAEADLYSRSRMVMCPMTGFAERPAADCRGCESFVGIGEVKINGEATAEQKFRAICKFPRPRQVRLGARQEGEDYRERMGNAIEKSNRPELKMELNIFVNNGCSLNCPVARAMTGTWQVASPPCPVCPHYRGLKVTSDKLKVSVNCAHPFSIRFKRTVMGGMLI